MTFTPTAAVIADSVTSSGDRLTTMQVSMHRYILAEFNTHRVFSRNAGSSRAIPTAKLLQRVADEPVEPLSWGLNRPGMQADEVLTPENAEKARNLWLSAGMAMAHIARELAELNVHKQVVNRLLEPFLGVSVVVSSTKWENFFQLRRHKDAQPEMQALAEAMYTAYAESTPLILDSDQWHLPYILQMDREQAAAHLGTVNDDAITRLLLKISTARCARVSYKTFDGTVAPISADLELYEKLVGAQPMHASPSEHQGLPDPHQHSRSLWGNFYGWVQHRKLLVGEQGGDWHA